MGRAFEVRKQSMMKTGAMKSAIYGRAAKEIYMAAKSGPDPVANLALRSAIDKAKSKQVPADVISRAIKKASGSEHEQYIANRYEGYGPNGSMIIVDSLTTNVNRAIAEIREAFKKNHGNIGTSGAVSYAFQELAVFGFESMDVEATLEYLMEVDVDVQDVIEEEGITMVYGDFKSFNAIKTALDKKVKEYKVAEISMIPNETITLEGEAKINFDKLTDWLNELEDVQDVFHNVE
ncbi:transcriptional regulator [Spiroplasma sp. TIUS-1]|uniref:YebC/PmpR family DNA-binding transcriptional regulator n=1 Tax=Spiroplasma sp. TIUS-1 TaxID=216963 RepID=UPI0013986F06|nr:YebC/PmpR family DNA-binding transcriptional regulator [Spiroplasma sp. TIUS-1]QHX36022.1 transcriptional regulator [Spiroplasma sp. TIUS-1]